jgi:hypothetical protein
MSLRSALNALVTPISLPLLGGVVVGMSVAGFLVQPIWGDQSWYFYAAGRLLDGAHIDIKNIVEGNPPLIFWVSIIPVAIGRGLHLSPQIVLESCLAVVAACNIGWCAVLARRSDPAAPRAFPLWLAVVLLYATVVYAWPSVGQREHILILLGLPYLVMVGQRMDGVPVPVREAVVAGLLAAIGFALKPYQFLVVIAVESLLLWHVGVRRLIRPELLALALGEFAYAAAILAYAPDYIFKIMPLASAYLDYARVPLRNMIEPLRLLKILGMFALWAMLRPWLRHRGLASVFLVAGGAATVAYVVQLKHFEYQFLPGLAFLNIAFGIMVVDLLLRWTSRDRILPRPALGAALGLVAAVVAAIVYYPQDSAKAAIAGSDPRNATGLAVTTNLPVGTTIYELTPGTGFLFKAVLDRGLIWGSRFPHLWMLAAVLRAEQDAAQDGHVDAGAQRMLELGRWTRTAVAEDLERWHPSVVLVDRCDDRSIEPCWSLEAFQVNLVTWFEQDPAFKAEWSHYSNSGRLGPFDLWCPTVDTETCARLLAAGVGPTSTVQATAKMAVP